MRFANNNDKLIDNLVFTPSDNVEVVNNNCKILSSNQACEIIIRYTPKATQKNGDSITVTGTLSDNDGNSATLTSTALITPYDISGSVTKSLPKEVSLEAEKGYQVEFEIKTIVI